MRDTIDMAHEAGLIVDANQSGFDAVLAFEALVRADERDRAMRENAYVQAEREACAKWVDHILKEGGGTYGDAIRARGNT
jgi:hypothetical protein